MEGGKATFKGEYYGSLRQQWIRFCEEEPETSQWLGLSRVGLKLGYVLPNEEIPRQEVTKRFRYPSR